MPSFRVSIPAVITVTVEAENEGQASQQAQPMFAELPGDLLNGRVELRVGEIIQGVSDLSIERVSDRSA